MRAHDVQVFVINQARKVGTLGGAFLAVLRLIRSWRADLVHAHMMTSAVLAYPACKLAGRPLVTTVHNAFERSAVLMAVGSRVIAVSEAVGQSMRKRGVPASRLRVVLNGTIGSARMPKPYPEPEVLDHPSVLFVGGLHPRKGVGDLLTAFDIVHRAAPRATLYLVGEGPSEAEYRAMVDGMACRGAVRFCGAASDPRSYFRAADILVLPSHADPAPLVLSEAREGGCAIVASAVDGIPELLEHGRAGILVPPGSPDLLADALLLLVQDPQVLASWRQSSQFNIERMSIARVARDTLSVYAECFEHGPLQLKDA
ncbi:hypothetical protein K32_10530 [Kaistia sp. 32K]|nr:hypothetical protein K32_10530 [Kaistia sp. 32K]